MSTAPNQSLVHKEKCLKAKIFTLGEWYSCRGLALVASSVISTLGFKEHGHKHAFLCTSFHQLVHVKIHKMETIEGSDNWIMEWTYNTFWSVISCFYVLKQWRESYIMHCVILYNLKRFGNSTKVLMERQIDAKLNTESVILLHVGPASLKH